MADRTALSLVDFVDGAHGNGSLHDLSIARQPGETMKKRRRALVIQTELF
jgi:hypothetical protein